jgi:hypothetical protein
MCHRVDQASECSQSDFLMPPWKIDKKAWLAGAVNAHAAPADGYDFVQIRANFSNISALRTSANLCAARRTKKPQSPATLQRRNLGVDLGLALT